MPWRETCPMDQRVALVADWLREDWTVAELAARYGVTRKTVYKWLERYEADAVRSGGAVAGAQAARAGDERRGARRAAGQASPASAVGAKKLRAVLAAAAPTVPWPAPSTMGMRCGARG